MPIRVLTLALVLAASLAMAPPSRALVVVEPTFSGATGLISLDVAASGSGEYYIMAMGHGTDMVSVRRRFAQQWHPHQLLGAGYGERGVIAPALQGGFTTVWKEGSEVAGRFLDLVGMPSGTPFHLNHEGFSSSQYARVGSVSSGAVVLWEEDSRDVSPRLFGLIGGQQRVLVQGPAEFEVASTPSGGCVIAWRFFDAGTLGMQAQVFDGTGDPLGPAFAAGAGDLALSGVAASPLGPMAIVGARATGGEDVYEIVVYRFDAAGTPLSPPISVDIAAVQQNRPLSALLPQIEFDFAGNIYVVWGDWGIVQKGLRARAFDPDGAPLGPSVTIAEQAPSLRVETARRPDGRFVNAWVTDGSGFANVVSLCAPGTAVCGDGVVSATCERCDDGAANSDTTPDACRTSCLPPSCGDGVTDGGEECDDGNFDRCDGCDASCKLEPGFVCGDGVVSNACGEQCDDGNGALLDGCTPSCTLERIPGGGPSKTDCFSEWSIDNPTTVPALDKHGAINVRQSCVDDDPRCDFDGGVPGSCSFHVRVCANNGDIAGCPAPTRLSSWTLDRPSDKNVAKNPALGPLRTALVSAVPGALVGPSTLDACTGVLPLVVPLRGTAGDYKVTKLQLKAHATAYDGTVDKDRLFLECRPAN